MNNPWIAHEAVNVQKARIDKPHVKYLDSVKSSNFLNFLHTQKNELLTNERQDYYHPRMFYLTNDRSQVANFQKKEYYAVKADFASLNSGKLKKSLRRGTKHSASEPPGDFMTTKRQQHQKL